MAPENSKISVKHLAFVNEYMQCYNATLAYMKIYPNASYDASKVNASKLLTNTNVKTEIEKRMKSSTVTADEVIAGISSIAYAFDVRTSDRLRAFELLGRFHKLFTDKFEIAQRKTIKVTIRREE